MLVERDHAITTPIMRHGDSVHDWKSWRLDTASTRRPITHRNQISHTLSDIHPTLCRRPVSVRSTVSFHSLKDKTTTRVVVSSAQNRQLSKAVRLLQLAWAMPMPRPTRGPKTGGVHLVVIGGNLIGPYRPTNLPRDT